MGLTQVPADTTSSTTLARSYQPFGTVLSSTGAGATSYAFTGEWQDGTSLIHLRARYYSGGQGRFITRDQWRGDYRRPLTLNGWNYSFSNPVNYTDPSGHCPKGWQRNPDGTCTFTLHIPWPFGIGISSRSFTIKLPLGWCENQTSIQQQPTATATPRPNTPTPAPGTAGPTQIGTQAKGTPTPSPTPTAQPKACQSQAFTVWMAGLLTRSAPAHNNAYLYQIRVAGPIEYSIIGGDRTIWADGVRAVDCYLLEAKYVGDPATSPYVPGSSAPDFVKRSVDAQVSSEMLRYAAALNDPNVPAIGLEVITSDLKAVPYFQAFITAFGVLNGRVVVIP
ncbi:MAG: hypothetical protein MN733_07510 [Nitrososphaera sp.]|nr:hypothetical protein [Nitrososphaera sp.]